MPAPTRRPEPSSGGFSPRAAARVSRMAGSIGSTGGGSAGAAGVGSGGGAVAGETVLSVVGGAAGRSASPAAGPRPRFWTAPAPDRSAGTPREGGVGLLGRGGSGDVAA